MKIILKPMPADKLRVKIIAYLTLFDELPKVELQILDTIWRVYYLSNLGTCVIIKDGVRMPINPEAVNAIILSKGDFSEIIERY